MNMIGVLDTLHDLFGLIGVELDVRAEHLTRLIGEHAKHIARVDDTIASQDLTQVLRLVRHAICRLAVYWQVVVLVWQLSLATCHFHRLFFHYYLIIQFTNINVFRKQHLKFCFKIK